MLPQYANPYKKTKEYKNQMQHQLKFFRFNHKTHVPTNGKDLTIEEFFAKDTPKIDEDVKLLDQVKMRPQKQ